MKPLQNTGSSILLSTLTKRILFEMHTDLTYSYSILLGYIEEFFIEMVSFISLFTTQ